MRTMDDDLFNLKKEKDKHVESKNEAEKSIASSKEASLREEKELKKVQKERENYDKEAQKEEREYNEEKERFTKNYVRLVALNTTLEELRGSNKKKMTSVRLYKLCS